MPNSFLKMIFTYAYFYETIAFLLCLFYVGYVVYHRKPGWVFDLLASILSIGALIVLVLYKNNFDALVARFDYLEFSRKPDFERIFILSVLAGVVFIKILMKALFLNVKKDTKEIKVLPELKKEDFMDIKDIKALLELKREDGKVIKVVLPEKNLETMVAEHQRIFMLMASLLLKHDLTNKKCIEYIENANHFYNMLIREIIQVPRYSP